MRVIVVIVISIVTFCSGVTASAAPLFDDGPALEIKLVGPLQNLVKNTSNQTELPFVVQANGVKHSIKVRTRGKSRLRVCKFPLLRLNFKRDATTDSVFASQDKIKLVTQCNSTDKARTDILEEYAAYKILNKITDVAYKVRLVRVTYIDSNVAPSDEATAQYGFFLESAAELEARLSATRVQTKGVTLGSFDLPHLAKMFVFQYLIANTDWSLVTADLDAACCHNGDLFDIDSKRFYVPFDFDLAGLVNAAHARPDASIGISRVTARRYRGYCIPEGPLREAVSTIQSNQSSILGVLDHIQGLTPKDIRSRKKYLEHYFKEAAQPDKLLRNFEKRCLG